MKRLLLPALCLVVGCAVGATIPVLTAQEFQPNPEAPRWDQFCENVSARNLSAHVAAKGRDGWRLVSHTFPTQHSGRHSVPASVCFQRPAR